MGNRNLSNNYEMKLVFLIVALLSINSIFAAQGQPVATSYCMGNTDNAVTCSSCFNWGAGTIGARVTDANTLCTTTYTNTVTHCKYYPVVKATPLPVSRLTTVPSVTGRTGTMLLTMQPMPQLSDNAQTPPLTPPLVPQKSPTVTSPFASSQLVMSIPRDVPNALKVTRVGLPPLLMLMAKPLVSLIALPPQSQTLI